jgi:hypothetical protein
VQSIRHDAEVTPLVFVEDTPMAALQLKDYRGWKLRAIQRRDVSLRRAQQKDES